MLRRALPTLLAVAVLAGCAQEGPQPAVVATSELPLVTMYLSPTCGCCTLWGEHMETYGFRVVYVDTDDLGAIKREFGVPPVLGSCHTALVGDYVVEGHVPAREVIRLLEERPEAVGLAVPGMPIGSPGMEMPGREPDPYSVLLFDAEGDVRVFARY